MTTKPTTCGWDQAVYRCGRCGTEHTATTEDDYLKAVGVHSDAHAVWDRLNPVERDGLASILRTILAAPDLARELLALANRHKHLAGGDTSASDPRRPITIQPEQKRPVQRGAASATSK